MATSRTTTTSAGTLLFAALRLGTVACAIELRYMIEQGVRRLDMGPGDTLTKRELGGELHGGGYSTRIWSPSYRGRALRLGASARERARGAGLAARGGAKGAESWRGRQVA